MPEDGGQPSPSIRNLHFTVPTRFKLQVTNHDLRVRSQVLHEYSLCNLGWVQELSSIERHILLHIRPLLTRPLTTISTDEISSHPTRLRTTHHPNNTSNLLRVSHATSILRAELLCLWRIPFSDRRQRSERIEHCNRRLDLITSMAKHVRHGRADADAVDSGILCELPGPSSCHGFKSALGTTVQSKVLEPDLASNTGDTDDSTRAISGEVRLACLS